MMNDLKSGEAAIKWRAQSKSVVAAICLACIFLILSVLLVAQQADSTGSQESSGSRVQSSVTVPARTRMMVRMIDPVDSEKNRASDRFRGALEANLMAGDVLVAPKGTTVYGRLLAAESAGRRAGAELELDITEIMIDGNLHSLTTSSHQIQGEQGTRAGATARGAATGAAVGSMVGAGAGFGARAGAITGNVKGGSTRGEKVKVPAGSLVEFTLEHPVSLPVARS